MRFLIVDDSSTMRRIIINTLNRLGYADIVEAGNGREGLDPDEAFVHGLLHDLGKLLLLKLTADFRKQGDRCHRNVRWRASPPNTMPRSAPKC